MGMHGGGFMHRATVEQENYKIRNLDRAVIRMFIKYLHPYRWKLLLTLTLMIVVAGMNMAAPYVSKIAVDTYIANNDLAGLNLILLAYVMIYGIYWLASYHGSYLSLTVGHRVVADIRKDLYAHVSSLSLDFFADRQTGGIMSRLTNDVNAMMEFISQGIVSLVSGIVTIVGVLVIMFLLNMRLTLVVLATVPIILAGTVVMGRLMRTAYGNVRQKVGALNAGVEENLSGIRVVKSMAQESENEISFDRLNKDNLKAHIRAVTITALFFPFMSVSSTLGTVLVILMGGIMVVNGQATIGLVLAFLGYTSRLFMPLRELSQIYNVYQSAAASAERIHRYLEVDPTIKDPENPVQILQPVTGQITFDAVTFGYSPQRPVIHRISTEISPGDVVAIVGPTGAGKSTMAKLLARLYDPQEGQIRIDGIDLKRFKGEDLRKIVMIVPQEVFLFNGTIADNIRYGDLKANDSGVVEAAIKAHADPFIKQLPLGYNTQVGEAGMLLSGGQRQLIAFARAVLSNRPILVLDEATSSVDAATEVLIQKALETLLQGRTSILIAHRFTTLRKANRIMVMDEGRLVATGSHEELITESTLYRNLYEKQWKIS